MPEAKPNAFDVGGRHIYIHEVENLVLIGQRTSLRIGDATVMTRAGLRASLAARGRWSTLRQHIRDLLQGDTFIVLPVSGVPRRLEPRVIQCTREALWVLASTLLLTRQRGECFRFGLSGQVGQMTRRSAFVCTTSDAACGTWARSGATVPVVLDDLYWSLFRSWRLDRHLGCGTNRYRSKRWRHSLWRAAVCIGRSQQSSSMSDALLYQMFALEAMLLEKANYDLLARRVQGLLGWMIPDIEQNIRRLCDIRNALVHDGYYGALAPRDLFLCDLYAANVFGVIAAHPQRWKNKQQLVSDADRLYRTKSWSSVRGLQGVLSKFREADYSMSIF